MAFSVRQARRYADKSQNDIADAMKICVQTYRSLENHPERFTIAQAKLLSELTHVPVNDIFFGQ